MKIVFVLNNNCEWSGGFVFKTAKANGISGYNFGGFAGLPQNVNRNGFMQKGMAYSADTPQEEQGLYAVFMSDSNTWHQINLHK